MKIVQISDTHIFNLKRHDVYRIQFEKIYKKLEEIKPDRIAIIGDTLNDFVSITNEAKLLVGQFLNRLSEYAPIILVYGNHEFMKSNHSRINSIKTVVELLNNKRITYFDKSGFYEDDDIIWVNYEHQDKNTNPWDCVNIEIPKNIDDKITIGLFHDPVYESKTFQNNKFNIDKYKPTSYFNNNNFLFCGDIHEFQYLREDKSAAYSSSTIQIDFSENPIMHGFILWDIKSKTDFDSTYYDIPNEYNYINLDIKKGFNYDNIDLDNEHITHHSEIKVKWYDYIPNLDFSNEMKIRQYIKDKWNIDKVKFDRRPISTNIEDVEMITESINVLDEKVQRDIFIDFLKLNKHPKEDIKSIMEIDDKINERLSYEKTNGVVWTIETVFGNNYKSLGDGNVINFKDMGVNKLIKINGLNAAGKTTIIDLICYVLYGRNLGTSKRIKAGDSRFINNKRSKDFCDGGIVINIDGEKYTILRTTVRKWNKDKKSISSATTTVEYYIGDDLSIENKMNEEQRKDTQKLIEETIGDFDSFLRLVLVNSDTLNSSLSADRASFIDSLIVDAGFDIFDKKLTEFKEYRKEITEKRKNIDIDNVNSEIDRITEEKSDKENTLKHEISVIVELSETRKLQNQIREEKIKQLDKIDENLKKMNIDEIESNIDIEGEIIVTNELELEKIEELKEEISNYDSSILDEKEDKYDILNETITNARLGKSEFERKISESNNEIKLLGIDIDNIVSNYTNDLNSKNKDIDMDIMKIKEEFVANINVYLSSANQKISNVAEKQSKIHTDIERLMEEGKFLKIENHELENSSVCITCKRPLEDVDMSNIEDKITSNRDKMAKIMEKVGELKPLHEELGKEIYELRDSITKIKDKDYTFDPELLNTYNISKEKIKKLKKTIENNVTIIDLIKNNNIPTDLKGLLSSSYKRNSELSLYINDLQKELENVDKDLIKKQEEHDSLKNSISKLKEVKNDIDSKKEQISNETKISMNIEKSKNKIKEFEKQIEEYKNTLDKIKSNELIEKDIEGLDEILLELDTNITEKTDKKMNIHSTIKLFESQLEQYKEDIITYENNKKQDEIMTTYMKCVHRDGLPFSLMQRSIHIINQELAKILMGVDFTVYFDDELNLKLSADNRLDIAQNAIESSGMERTFTSVSLKMALRKVNNKSKPNFILLDEIMGKLISESVDIFIQLLDNIKQDVDKLVIIEHVHPINYDILIEVEKDIEGISKLNVEY